MKPRMETASASGVTFSFRRANTSDVVSLSVLFDAYRQFYGQPADPGLAEHFLHQRLSNSQSVVVGAWQGDQLVGFCQLYPGFSSIDAAPSWTLGDLFVVPEARRQGIAQGLMAAAEVIAREQGAVSLNLQTARDNLAAQTLYRNRGWQLESRFLTYELSLT